MIRLFLLLLPGFAWAQATPHRPVPVAELLNLALPVCIVAIFSLLFYLYRRDQKKTLRLMEANYRAALLGTDKVRAYELGFLYYCALRANNTPTEKDQAKLLHELRLMGFTSPVHRSTSSSAAR
jgi:hypothetical protein